MVTSPLIRPYFLGGVSSGGGTLDSHDNQVPEAPREPTAMKKNAVVYGIYRG